MVVLAVATAAYGVLAGPVMRALFGGPDLAWPPLLAPHLPPAPSAEALRRVLPFCVLAAALIKAAAQRGHVVAVANAGQTAVATLRRTMHARVLALPPDVVAALRAGDLLSRFTHDAEASERLVTIGWAALVRDGLQAVALVVACVLVDWRLAGLTFVVYPAAIVPIARFARRLRQSARRTHIERARLAVELHSQLDALPLIQVHGEIDAASRDFGRINHAVADAVISAERVRAVASPAMEVLGAAALAGTLLYAVSRIDAGTLAAEHVLSFFASLMMLYQPVKGVVRALAVIEPGRIALARIDEILAIDAALPIGRPGVPPPLASRRGPRVVVAGVAVERGGRPALAAIDAVFESGRVTALTGPNGAGKTTLAWTIAGLLRPSAGVVRVDGITLESFDLQAWRACIGWVPQEARVTAGAIRDVVAIGADQASLDRVAREVGLDAVIARLPDGWDTVLGDGGAGLSGGERQRVALARALVREPSLLVLDEPEAHLDDTGIADICALLPILACGRTVVLITHSSALSGAADDVVRLGAPVARAQAAA